MVALLLAGALFASLTPSVNAQAPQDSPAPSTSPNPSASPVMPRPSVAPASGPGLPVPPPAVTITSVDPDHDGLPSTWETRRSRTNPHKRDSDRDGRRDGQEDPDRDGLNNLREYALHLLPRRSDTDHDGRKDGDEDADHDRLSNALEIRLGLRPDDADSDDDGIRDGAEDMDHDGLSNRFEVRSTRTGPRHADSNQDGVRDGASDTDGDGLSDAGEERAHTNPRRVDTDRDGTDDWHEDADRNGTSNGMEQDRRPLPKVLTPRLSTAYRQRPAGYTDGCHATRGVSVPFVCSYYGTSSSRSLFLVGDSHAQHWQPAFMDIARRHGWRLYSSTKSSCPMPSVSIALNGTEPDTECDTWREGVFQGIEALRPDLVITASRNDNHIVGAFDIDSDDNLRLWHDGMVASLARLDAIAGRVLLLGDTPQWAGKVPACLQAHPRNMSACERRRDASLSTRRATNDERAAADAGVVYAPTAQLICPYDPCPVVIDQFILSWDEHHVQPSYAVSLARGLERLLPTADQAVTARRQRDR